MASNIKKFKCLIHFNETQRGSILSEDLTYSMLHEMVMQKFKLEANAVINLSFKLSPFDFAVDITDDAEKNEGPSNQEIPSSHLNDSLHMQNEPHFSNPDSSFAFRSNEYNTDDMVNENPQNKIHKWQKFMSFEPDIPEIPVYKAKSNISKSMFNNRSELVRGSPYEAFEMLPYYCYNLEKKNQGTVTRIKTDDNGVFEMLFIAIGASGIYKGTNLVAVAMDGNNQIVPIAFGICKGETGPCWSWWMSVLKECIGDNPNLLFISDRHAAIALAVEKEFPLAFHVVCCRHLMMNLGLKNKKRKGLFWKICKAYTREDYATNMNTLQIVQPDAHEKLCRAGPQRWSRAHCPLVRYNYMTSNSVESVNACSVIYRKEPVLKLAETYRAMVQEWYYKRRQLAANMTYEITDWAANKVAKKKLKSATWVVKGVNAYQYEVSDGQYIREVNLQTGICGCRKWQLSGLPCGHVIAITRFLGLTDCLNYMADWFKKPKYQATYSESIHSLGNMQQWEFPENIQRLFPLHDNHYLDVLKNY
ncbi:transposase, MuDR, MULE transposase domain protein [Tanacetum coccineum]|uniref:Transposase, MuDR, MULE transposase domain protein n=1 Tax=Tanacetum coccineum TaxID=301880 RepID=A0ABQ4Y082_9ASTR